MVGGPRHRNARRAIPAGDEVALRDLRRRFRIEPERVEGALFLDPKPGGLRALPAAEARWRGWLPTLLSGRVVSGADRPGGGARRAARTARTGTAPR